MAERLSEAARRQCLRDLGIVGWQQRAQSAGSADAKESVDERASAAAAGSIAAPTPVASAGEAPAQAPVQAPMQTAADWASLAGQVQRCTRCRLHETRTRAVFGVGPESARLMVIGEAPGAEEDRRGEPFVGRAGQMLDAMLKAIDHPRETVFIANVIKCRPPQNRDPREDEVSACADYLGAQIAHVRPALLLAVGRIAAQHLLGESAPLGQLRQRTDLRAHGVPTVVTYHPAYLLRTPAQKAKAWEDLKRVRAALRGDG